VIDSHSENRIAWQPIFGRKRSEPSLAEPVYTSAVRTDPQGALVIFLQRQDCFIRQSISGRVCFECAVLEHSQPTAARTDPEVSFTISEQY
jgi:hypothetical protein